MNPIKTNPPYEVRRISLMHPHLPPSERPILERRSFARFVSVTNDYGSGCVTAWGREELHLAYKLDDTAFNGIWTMLRKLPADEPFNKAVLALVLSLFPSTAKKTILKYTTPKEFMTWVMDCPTEVLGALGVNFPNDVAPMSPDCRIYRADQAGLIGKEKQAFVDRFEVPERFLPKTPATKETKSILPEDVFGPVENTEPRNRAVTVDEINRILRENTIPNIVYHAASNTAAMPFTQVTTS